MASSAIFFFAFFLGLSLHAIADNLNDLCSMGSCRPSGPEIRFPFWIRGVQPERCGYPGFDLSCNDLSQAILQLPDSQDFVVSKISYEKQYVVLKDPSNCLAKRLQNPKFSSSIFIAQGYGSFMFADCPNIFLPEFGLRPMSCLSDEQHKVPLGYGDNPNRSYLERFGCRTWTVKVPVALQYPKDITESVTLEWNQPDCRSCEGSGGRCGLNGYTGSQAACFRKPGLSKGGAKWGQVGSLKLEKAIPDAI
ncbi:putative RING-H2 finger protein ATL21A [Eucalyptus grandis]|uniref:putative RING-H2 finger protein ATL21A n=1 Tax=Eucalyptus grandis TaxID=71139 RepID=UPI00192ECA90|nr:putative RING-H2 finger protein ATL21A [Eucalyptus grandis]